MKNTVTLPFSPEQVANGTVRKRNKPASAWTVNSAIRQTETRLNRIEKALTEISALWGDYDQSICMECDFICDGGLQAIRDGLKEIDNLDD